MSTLLLPPPPPPPLTHRHVLTLPARPAAVRLARETAEQAFAEWGVSPRHRVMGAALLILSELVTNCVRHAAPLSESLTVTYALGAGSLVFAVHDRHPYRPVLDDVTAHGTGGLATVMELTGDLDGTAVVRGDRDDRGKSIWVTLPL